MPEARLPRRPLLRDSVNKGPEAMKRVGAVRPRLSIMLAVYRLLLLFGELLNIARKVDPNKSLVSDDRSIVPRANHVHVPSPYLLLGAVVHINVHSPRNHVPRVLNLATIRPCERLDAFGPLPARLKRDTPCGNLIDVGYLHLALIERARLVRGIQTLGLDGVCMGHAPPFPFSGFLPGRCHLLPCDPNRSESPTTMTMTAKNRAVNGCELAANKFPSNLWERTGPYVSSLAITSVS